MRIKQLLYLIIFLCGCYGLHAQGEESTNWKAKGIDIGINVTSVISSFSGNGNFTEASDFPLIFRFGKKNLNIRLGLGANGSSKELFDNVTFAFRESSFKEFFLRLGFEKNLFTEKKLNMYWGLDFIGKYDLDRVNIFESFGGQNRIQDQTIGFGGGPIIGIKYHLSKRLYFSSEATLYALVNLEQYKEEGLAQPVTVNTTSYDFSLQPPLLLYLNYKL